MNIKKMLIAFIGIVLVSATLLGTRYINSRRHNATSIELEYKLENSTLYPYKNYVDQEKNIAQVELSEMCYEHDGEQIVIALFGDDNKEIDIKQIESTNKTNEYSAVTEKKYILQFSLIESDYYIFHINVEHENMYTFKIDIRDFAKHNLIEKGLDYFANYNELITIQHNLKKKIDNRPNDTKDFQKEYDDISIKIKQMNDTDFINYSLLENDNCILGE